MALYQVEDWVRSNLRSHKGKPYRFTLRGGEATLLLPSGGDSSEEGFVAQTRVEAANLLEANRIAHDLMTGLLDLLCHEMRVTGVLTRPIRTQLASTGETRRCLVYGSERRARSLYLMDKQAEEVQRLLDTKPETNVRQALYWLRWAYAAATVPVAFLFIWMAIERLVGDEKVSKKCSSCGRELFCTTHEHNPQTHTTVARSATKSFLERHGVPQGDTLLRLRNPLVHGSLPYDFAKWLVIRESLPSLAKAVENELRERLGVTDGLRVSPLSSGGEERVEAHLEYRTSYPAEPFPSDCPTYDDFLSYKEATEKGRSHPRIVEIAESPPRW